MCLGHGGVVGGRVVGEGLGGGVWGKGEVLDPTAAEPASGSSTVWLMRPHDSQELSKLG